MFDLEKQIAAWRAEMLRAGIKNPATLDELENHLREDVERQTRTGMNTQPAFETAILRIGHAAALKGEFAKAAKGARSVEPVHRIILLLIFGLLFLPASVYAMYKNEMSLGWRLMGFAAIALVTMVILGWEYEFWSLPYIPSKRTRTTLGLICALMGAGGAVVFMNFILPRYAFNLGQVTVSVLWALTFMAALCGVWGGLEDAAKKTRGGFVNRSRQLK
jgi:hypothetical protein